jgi:myo-inositol-1(or 4)-monophosphatase
LPASEDAHQTKADLALLKGAAQEAAELGRQAFADGVKTWAKPGGSPVTAADLAIDALLKERLTAARPDYGWLSEETPDDPARTLAAKLFIIDPIDGTRAFVKGRLNWTISLAVVAGARPLVGVVIAPMLEETFEALAGGGARLNGETIRVSARRALAGAHVTGPQAAFTAQPGREPWPQIERDSISSLAYRLCLVACGARDAAANLGSFHEWDIAAADLILTEAGGRLTHLDGALPRYNKTSPKCPGLIAAPPALYPELFRRLGSP